MSDIQQAETPLSDHVARFWKHLETETVRITLDLKRTIGHDAPNGPTVYWDCATFSDDVAKALVAQRGKTTIPETTNAKPRRMFFWQWPQEEMAWLLWARQSYSSRWIIWRIGPVNYWVEVAAPGQCA
jgi:hypothetical protein